jgi:hypothetical protein
MLIEEEEEGTLLTTTRMWQSVIVYDIIENNERKG